MKIKTNNKKIEQALTKSVDSILPNKEELKDIMKKRKIRLYLGIDPTNSKLHLGHTITLRKLQEFADLGHEAILVIGTGTVLAGDPSLRESARERISLKEIRNNIKTWREQAGKVVDFSKVKIEYNGDWLLKLGLEDIIDISSNISAIKLFQREMFQRRIKKGDTVWAHEILYPLLQGYDSVFLDVDLEIGGTDQLFNMLIGRELQQKMRKKEKFVLTCPMIVGIDGKPMSKTSGNCIWVDDPASEKYGKIMSISDNLIFDYFELLADFSLEEIKKIKKSKINPRDLKARLARKIVSIYHGEKAASIAEEEFNRVFKEKKTPTKIPEIKIKQKKLPILDLLTRSGLVVSKAEAKRLIAQGGIKINGKVQDDRQKTVEIEEGTIIQIGKRRFVKIK